MEWRALTSREAGCLGRLVAMQFPGAAALREQVRGGIQARTLDEDGSIELHGPPGPKLARTVREKQSGEITVEVRGPDRDGTDVVALLHVRDGLLRELEFFRPTGGTVVELPAPEAWREHAVLPSHGS
jgi:hypothetical protein